MFSKEIFTSRLREERQRKGLTMEQLGKEFGVTKQTVSHWEKGERLPPLNVACDIADFFEVSLDYLVGQTKQYAQEV